MSYTLVIVESPNKTSKIQGFLGQGYRCVATFGHFRDLPKTGELGVTFEAGRVKPTYVASDKGSKVIPALKKAAKDAAAVVLASDPDREGEAISWHVQQVLRGVPCRRATFNQITADAVRTAISRPRAIDQHLVDAQQARRVLDRCVGWWVSGALRRALGGAKSAGRVQSVAVRLVCEREREITAFKPQTSFGIEATLQTRPNTPTFVARLVEWEGVVIGQSWTSRTTADQARQLLETRPWRVVALDSKTVERKAPPPFVTSTIQQAASVALKLNPDACMAALQRLFEAGHITYHRTDSVTLSPEAVAGARELIAKGMGKGYLPATPPTHASRAGAADAHEAIRPTHWETGPRGVAGQDADLYEMIWRRFIASQCAPGVDVRTTVRIAADPGALGTKPRALFVAKGVFRQFDGWRRVAEVAEREKPETPASKDDAGEDDDSEILLPKMSVEDPLVCLGLKTAERTTKPPARFSKAALIAALERAGVGRPSTYAAIITTIEERGYVEERKRKLHATELGMRATDYLIDRFAGDFIDVTYTARIESALDEIAAGKRAWEPFITTVAEGLLAKCKAAGYVEDEAPAADAPKCPQCQKPMALRTGSRGPFYGCTGYPKCKGTMPATSPTSADGSSSQAPAARPAQPSSTTPPPTASAVTPTCPVCQATMRERKSGTSRFWGCSRFPECRGTRPAAT